MLTVKMDFQTGFILQDDKVVPYVDDYVDSYIKHMTKERPDITITIGSELLLVAFRVKCKNAHEAKQLNIYKDVKFIYPDGTEMNLDKNGSPNCYAKGDPDSVWFALHLTLL